MKKCDWCESSTNELFKYNNLGTDYIICKSCAQKIKSNTCRCCGGPLGSNSIKGICLICIQTNSHEEMKEREEKSNGLDYEAIKEYTPEGQITEEEFSSWITSSSGKYGPAKRTEIRKNWLLKYFKNDPDWDEAKIDIYMPSIEKIMDNHFNKMQSKKFKLIIINGNTTFKPGSIVAIEKTIALVDTSV